jgi:ElaB/YqjD/DUF883 family membrane-anchored ribosome-binding protein
MNYLVLVYVGIGLIFGFILGMLLTKKRVDFLDSLTGFIIFAKQENKTDDDIRGIVKYLTDILLAGYKNAKENPEAANENLKKSKKDLKEQKALIKAMQKTIDKSNNFLKKFNY